MKAGSLRSVIGHDGCAEQANGNRIGHCCCWKVFQRTVQFAPNQHGDGLDIRASAQFGNEGIAGTDKVVKTGVVDTRVHPQSHRMEAIGVQYFAPLSSDMER